MLDYLPTDAGVIAIRIANRLEKEELEPLLDRVEASLESHAQTHLYIEIDDLKGIEFAELGDYLKRSLGMLQRRERFGRIAIVSNQPWIRWASKVESALIPNLSYEIFLPHERDRALAWVKGQHIQPHEPALKIIETSRPDVIGFEIDGKLTVEEVEATAAYFAAAMSADQPLRILGRIKHIGGVELAGLFNRDYLAMKLHALHQLERYALVGAPALLRDWANLLAPLFKAEIQCFEADEEALAWSWLGAVPVDEKALVA